MKSRSPATIPAILCSVLWGSHSFAQQQAAPPPPEDIKCVAERYIRQTVIPEVPELLAAKRQVADFVQGKVSDREGYRRLYLLRFVCSKLETSLSPRYVSVSTSPKAFATLVQGLVDQDPGLDAIHTVELKSQISYIDSEMDRITRKDPKVPRIDELDRTNQAQVDKLIEKESRGGPQFLSQYRKLSPECAARQAEPAVQEYIKSTVEDELRMLRIQSQGSGLTEKIAAFRNGAIGPEEGFQAMQIHYTELVLAHQRLSKPDPNIPYAEAVFQQLIKEVDKDPDLAKLRPKHLRTEIERLRNDIETLFKANPDFGDPPEAYQFPPESH